MYSCAVDSAPQREFCISLLGATNVNCHLYIEVTNSALHYLIWKYYDCRLVLTMKLTKHLMIFQCVGCVAFRLLFFSNNKTFCNISLRRLYNFFTILSRQKRPGYKHSIAIAISTACFMLPWQVSLYFMLIFSLASKIPSVVCVRCSGAVSPEQYC